MIFKCKMCGGALEVKNGETVATCEYCGTKQTIPRLDDDKRATMYDRANHFRRNNEFDKAAGIYEQILNEDNTDAEAYWSLVLCRYGIEYVEDPYSHKRIPTVNRAQFTSVFDDDNYKSALRYADDSQRGVYENEANAINEIQKGILAISQEEEPFDVFICYKETDSNGKRTQDSVIANDLYNELTEEGFKVFFSRITLEDKLGTAYEPYIFAALNSAKVMVVVGTKPEYFNAVWVKNEWSRYLALIKNGAKKMLIPAYRDMDPYDLPEEFSHLQAQDMSKLGFMQDLIRGIKKIVKAEQSKTTTVVRETVVSAEKPDVEPLLKRAFMFLEDGDWASADEYCRKILYIDSRSAEAYLCKLMAELKLHRRDDFQNCEQPFYSRADYFYAEYYGSEQLKAELNEYEVCAKERAEAHRKDRIYTSAKSQIEGGDIQNYEQAIKLFDTIHGWKDSDKQICVCEHKIKEIKDKKEAERIAEENACHAAWKAKKRRKIIIAVTASTLVVVIVCTILFVNVLTLNKEYNVAINLYEAGKYDEAITAFQALNGYKDSEEQIENCYFGKYGEKYSLIKGVKAGDIYKFGSYEQDNNLSNGKEDIEWVVLERDVASLFLISKYTLDCQQYNTSYIDVTWETCSLRKWLNETFINAAFTKNEQSLLKSTNVSGDKNPSFDTDPGNATTDKIFLLSITETKKYFQSKSGKVYENGECEPSKYAVANGVRVVWGDKCIWWLRTSGYHQDFAAQAGTLGFIYSEGYRVDQSNIGVRPALWIGL